MQQISEFFRTRSNRELHDEVVRWAARETFSSTLTWELMNRGDGEEMSPVELRNRKLEGYCLHFEFWSSKSYNKFFKPDIYAGLKREQR